MYSPEKKSLIRFVALFIVSNTIFLLIISTMYYYYQKNIFIDIRHDSMTYYSNNQKHHIFDAKNMTEVQHHLSHDPRFEIAFLDRKQKLLYASSADLTFPFALGHFEYQHHYFYIDTVELQHLKKIHYIVIRANTIDAQLEQTRKSIYLFLIFSIFFLSAVIYALGKLFLQPVRDAIHKLDRFIRDTTHELNTPISVITMSIEQLNQDSLPKQQKHIDRISVASRTISNLYNDLTFLLMYDQTKQNDLDLRLDELLQERIDYFYPVAEAKKITIHTDFQSATYKIDRENMIRLIDNLLSNAIKYNKPMGNIYITLTPTSLSVRDTGIGIPPNSLEQIFNRYTRLDEANGGFGIGLNIIRMICQEYSLKINVKSELSKGSEFTVSWEKSSH
ncbi:MAG: HAMP domain-containing sensor histidine kinase [Sulfuricurvum sp.]|nr:HAMP domain-containing sensor histidine kinase [Sulfuricurvum sp.]